MRYQNIIFDLDGVICHTDAYHYQAWKALADRLGIYFDEEMNKEIKDKKLNLFIFVITDIINTNSKIIALGDSTDIVEKAFGQKLDSDNSMMLEGVVSRKKQIVPPIVKNL